MEEEKKEQEQGVGKAPSSVPQKKEKINILQEISGMSGDDLWKYAVTKVLIPHAKKAVIEILTTYLNTKAVPTSTGTKNVSYDTSRESYSNYYVDKTDSAQSVQAKSSYSRSVYDYSKLVIFRRYEQAQETLEKMQEILNESGRVKVADLYTIMSLPIESVDHIFGWDSLEGSSIEAGAGAQGECFQLNLPKAKPLPK